MGEVVPPAVVTSTKASVRPPGASTSGAVAGQERLGRLAVDGHHPDVVLFDFDRNDSALAAIDKAKPEPFDWSATEISSEVRPLTV